MSLDNCWAADFETTTDEDDCRVWAYSICNVEDYHTFYYGKTIDEFFNFIKSRDRNFKIWFHNAKFDFQFLLSYILSNGYRWIDDPKLKADNTFTTLITDRGQFYSIKIYFKVKGHHTHKVEFFDSLKIFPNFSVEKIAESFDLPIRKLSIDYKVKRTLDHELTQQEIDYIRNDVEIMARALNAMFNQGLTKMTIASDAMHDFKSRITNFRRKFPLLDPEIDADIRKSYRGGFTYVNECWKGKIAGKGVTLDVNSLYPSVLVSPDCPLPYGKAIRFEGQYQPDLVYPLYIQFFTCSFDIKPGKIPSIQLRNNLSFLPNEYVKSSNGAKVSLALTKPDMELFLDQYTPHNIVYTGGWKFKAAIGYFDDYINHWIEQKIKAAKEGNGGLRTISKLLCNSIYGRFAISGKARQKAPYLDLDGVVRYYNLPEETRETCYLPVGTFCTAYARNKTIRTSQAIKDYTIKKYGYDGYIYSDTDSIKALLTDDDLEYLKREGIVEIDDYKLGAWACEEHFDRILAIRQKSYITEFDGKIHATVAGLPKYLSPIINFENFKQGFSTAGLDINTLIEMARKNGADEDTIAKLHHKLTYKYVKGGVILADTDFTIK